MGDVLSPGDGGGSARKDIKRAPWRPEEDAVLIKYLSENDAKDWNSIPTCLGLARTGRSCRSRWVNHLRPQLKKQPFTPEEERMIIELQANIMPGRTGSQIKNYYNTRVKGKRRAEPLYPPETSLESQQENQQKSPGWTVNQIKNYYNTRVAGKRRAEPLYPPDPSLESQQENQQNLTSSGDVNFLPYPQLSPNVSGCALIQSNVDYPLELSLESQPENQQNPSVCFTNFLPVPQQSSNISASIQATCDDEHYDEMCRVSSQTGGFQKHAQDLDEPMSDCHETKKQLASSIVGSVELPSFQYKKTRLSGWDPAPPSLDGLVQHALIAPPPSQCQSPQLQSHTVTASPIVGSASHPDPFSFNRTSTVGSSLEEKKPVEMDDESWILDGERKEIPDLFDYGRPDALLGKCWRKQGASCSKPPVIEADTNAAHPYEDSGSELNISARTSSSESSWLTSSLQRFGQRVKAFLLELLASESC